MPTTDDGLLSGAYAAESELGQQLTRHEMRHAGLTVLNVRRRAREMAREGEITATMTAEQIRDTVLDDLFLDTPYGWDDFSAIDWDAIIAFIEKLIPLI